MDRPVEVNWQDLLSRVQSGEEIPEEERQMYIEAARAGKLETVTEEIRFAPDMIDVVYYARFCCRIKIGFTTQLSESMRVLQVDELLAVEPGSYALEAKRHRQFADARLAGEWFRQTPALLAHIGAVKAGIGTNLRLRMVSTADACTYTGRSRQVLYRWAREGRITKYQSDGGLLWDAHELPPIGADTPPVLDTGCAENVP